MDHEAMKAFADCTSQFQFLVDVHDVELRVHDKITRFGLDEAIIHFTQDERDYYDMHLASAPSYEDYV